MNIQQTRQEAAKIIVDVIGEWLAWPSQSRTVYITESGDIDSYTVNRPSDHYADLKTISEWAFGDRDSEDPRAPLTENEIDGLIQLFCTDWLIEEVMNPETGADETLYYADELATTNA
jgi:hypothetical protein